jgi:predicted outer membrane protein
VPEGASTQDRRGTAQADRLDRQLAQWLLLENQQEIQIAQFAEEQAGNPQVREFAQRMVREHTDLLGKLQQFAPDIQRQPRTGGAQGLDQPGRPRPNRPDAAGREREGTNAPQGTNAPRREINREEGADRADGQTDPVAQADPERPGQADRIRQREGQDQPAGAANQPGSRRQPAGADRERPGGQQERGQGGQDQMAQVAREIGEQWVQTVKQELQQQKGAQFDVAFMTQQLYSHLKAQDTLEVFQQHATSPEFKQLLTQAEQSTKQHTEMARNLLRQVDRQENGGAERTNTPANRTRPGATNRSTQPQGESGTNQNE